MSEESNESLIGLGPTQDWESPYRRAVGSMLQTCLWAARNGFPKDAEAILTELETARPEHASPKHSRALTMIYGGRPEEAYDYLRRTFPDGKDEMATLTSCFALLGMQKETECLNLAQELLRTGTNEQVLGLCRLFLQDLSKPA